MSAWILSKVLEMVWSQPPFSVTHQDYSISLVDDLHPNRLERANRVASIRDAAPSLRHPEYAFTFFSTRKRTKTAPSDMNLIAWRIQF